jgi:hypothetical protein
MLLHNIQLYEICYSLVRGALSNNLARYRYSDATERPEMALDATRNLHKTAPKACTCAIDQFYCRCHAECAHQEAPKKSAILKS